MWLIDHTGGYVQPKIVSMNHIVEIVNNSDILNDLSELTRLAIAIRKKNLTGEIPQILYLHQYSSWLYS